MNIINDFNSFMTYTEIIQKYKHFGLTYGKLQTYIRQNKLKRDRPSFINRFNSSTNSFIEEPIKEDTLIYDNRVVKTKIPRNIKIDVIKDTIDENLKNVLMDKIKSIDKTILRTKKIVANSSSDDE